ncbi:MAG: NADP-dependent oxidoreductase [Myxococcota bacterium]
MRATPSMKAALVHRYGSLSIGDKPTPNRRRGEVAIRVAYSSTNPVDLETVNGKNKLLLPLRAPFVPGVDVAGTVIDADDDARVSLGERVVVFTGVPRAGAWAEQICVPESSVARVPTHLSMKDAAGLCLAGLAAYQALQALGNARSILIHGAAGAVGSVATQLALHASRSITAHVHSRDRDRLLNQGVEKVICYDREDFAATAQPVQGVIDTVGGATFKRSLRLVQPGGVIASLAAIPRPDVLRDAGFRVPFALSPLLRLAAAPRSKKGVRIAPIVTTPSGVDLERALTTTNDLTPRFAREVDLEVLPATLAERRDREGKWLIRITPDEPVHARG